MPKEENDFVLAQVRVMVKEEMDKNDCSHDWQHIQRVTRLALHLAKSLEGCDLFVVELAALLHDLNDHKYTARFNMERLLTELGVQAGVIKSVLHVIDNVSYSKQMQRIRDGVQEGELCKELMCVRDADRLDALGAIGIARCCAFTAASGKRLYNEEAWENDGKTAFGHFHDKLFKLGSLMCTVRGREIAGQRLQIMRTFIDQMKAEIENSIY